MVSSTLTLCILLAICLPTGLAIAALILLVAAALATYIVVDLCGMCRTQSTDI